MSWSWLTLLKERWLIRLVEGGSTYYVYAGPKGQPNDYKWVVEEGVSYGKLTFFIVIIILHLILQNVLFVSSVRPPDSFRFEPAGEGLFV